MDRDFDKDWNLKYSTKTARTIVLLGLTVALVLVTTRDVASVFTSATTRICKKGLKYVRKR
jgi:uncharacterized PurR-regulated membrane protein YhhQ (DUF165 family)